MSEKKISYDPQWQEQYASQIATSQEAVKEIRPGQRVFIGTGCAQPEELVTALTEHSSQLADVQIVHLLTLGAAPYADKDLAKHFSVNSFFIAANVRDAIQEGVGDYTPIFLSDIPRLFSSGQLPLDAALIQVTPPDEHGRCSLGISIDIVKSAAANAKLVIAEVNPRMPRTLGNSFIHAHDIDFLVPVDHPLIEVEWAESTEETARIGEYVAALVEDGSTIELGIGGVPHGVLQGLKGKKHLGIHTEMFTDAMVDLIEEGVIDGSLKSLDRGKTVASFVMGTQKLYDYIDNNPAFAFHPTEYVNDPFVIGRQNRMVAINVALEVDLTGQICADSLGTKFYSGIGGQVDFNRGAARSEGGKAIIAMPSTARNGTISRIVPFLTPGAGVVTTRGDIHYVVTEYGVAYLHGKSVQERALALISIAHLDYRDELLKEAIKAKYVRAELSAVNDIIVGPQELRTSFLLKEGALVSFRAIHPTDAPRIRNLFYGVSAETLYTRFMSRMKWISSEQVRDFVYIDHRNEVAIVGTIEEADGEHIIAVGRYYLDPKTNRAEVAFIVDDHWQGRGIGGFLLKHLITIAKRNGIAGFTAEVLRENRAMQTVFNHSGCHVESQLKEGVYFFDLNF
ncbi:MAG: GNAT family N-acetyltransferase [Nitrospiraceae bacterium]|nr:GNAT family N-acetyltransferase [Nitrospiraceae bacterium]